MQIWKVLRYNYTSSIQVILTSRKRELLIEIRRHRQGICKKNEDGWPDRCLKETIGVKIKEKYQDQNIGRERVYSETEKRHEFQVVLTKYPHYTTVTTWSR